MSRKYVTFEMKKLWKAIMLFLILAVIVLITKPVFATEAITPVYDLVIEDEADILTDEEEAELSEVMEPITQFGHVAFVSTLDNDDTQVAFCHNFYERHWGVDEVNGLVLLVDMDNRVIRLQSDGAIYEIVNEDYCDTITDNIYTYASDGDYLGCATKAFTQANALLNGQRIAQPMKYITNALVALILSVLIIFVYIMLMSSRKAPSTEELLDYIDYTCKVGEIEKTKVGRIRVYTPSSGGGSSGGSSGGSHHSSGGSSRSSSSSSSSSSHHSSGGGGQHKF